MNRRAMGDMGEARAAKALEDMGYAILAKNYRKRSGEIDLIAMQGDTLAFIEVKARTTVRYGQPAEAVTPLKQRRIAETAMAYIAENGLDDVDKHAPSVADYDGPDPCCDGHSGICGSSTG